MRTLIVAAFFASVAAIQNGVRGTENVVAFATTLPNCTKTCVSAAIEGNCKPGDELNCICNSPAFRESMVDCFRAACPIPTIFTTLRKIDELCERPRRDRRMEAWPYISIHIFSILCALIRIYTKVFMIRVFSPEDWLALGYFLIYIIYFGIGHHALMSAFGQDIWWIEPGDLVHALKLFWIDTPIYCLLMGLTKISIILFYIRLCHVYHSFCRICWICLAAILLNTVIFIFLCIFQCSPIRWNWDRYSGQDVNQKCLDLNALQWAMNITNIIFDVVVLILPIPLVIKMKSTLRRKVAIIFMFSLGVVVLVASCLKMRYNIIYGNSTNITWDYMDLMVWAGIESSVSVAAPCLPTVRLFLHRVWPSRFGRMFAFGAQGETTLDEYIKAEEEEVAQWSASVESPTQDSSTVLRPRRVVIKDEYGNVQGGRKDSLKEKKGMTEASRILRSVDETPNSV